MRVTDIEVQNTSLLLRWWWRLYDAGDSLWATIGIRLHAKPTSQGGPLAWNVTGSFFWAALHKIKSIFHWSTQWIIGDGRRINSWYDSWDGTPLFGNCNKAQRPYNQVLSLNQGRYLLREVAPNFNLQLTNCSDEIRWKWNVAGCYSSKSIYKLLTEGRKSNFAYPGVWTAKVPPSVGIFGYCLLKRKLLTRDALIRRGMHCDSGCAMCDNHHAESIVHLFFQCRYAKRVWAFVHRSWGHRIFYNRAQPVSYRLSVLEIWDRSRRIFMHDGHGSFKDWITKMMCTVWLIWRQRNKVIFRGNMIPTEIIGRRIVQEARLWSRFC